MSAQAQVKDKQGYNEKAVICKPRKEAQVEIIPSDTLILDFWPPEW